MRGFTFSLIRIAVVVVGLACASRGASRAAPAGGKKMVGMYIHQHWPYDHPYCARTWTVADYRGYAGALKQLGFNTILIWPMLEIVPDPPTPSDTANLRKIAQVIDALHGLDMRVWIVLCPNIR